ncbi:2-isopropylmalate synthase [Brucella melitensis]|uniref:2-isopropylmalate synthase n=1 Tax=Brucella melitensis TaxID=29459 RepID=UPI003C6CC159
MARERIYIYDTTSADGQQTLPARPQPRSERGRAKAKAGVCLGGQSLPARPQPRSERGRAKAKAGVCLGGQ